MRKLLLTIALLALPCLALGQGGTPAGGYNTGANGSSSSPSSAYTLSVSGGTVTATPTGAGLSSFSGTDAALVLRNVINATQGNCGLIQVQDGTYNFNTTVQASTGGYTHFYAVGFPPQIASNQYCKWIIRGESAQPFMGLFTGGNTAVQTSGVIFNVTAAGVTSAGAATNIIAAFWALPDTVNGIGPDVAFENVTIRFPNNTRGFEYGSWMWEAVDVSYDYVNADVATAYASLIPAVVGNIPMVGLTGTKSTKNLQHFRHCQVTGYYWGFEFDSEHTLFESSVAHRNVYPEVYGAGAGTGTVFDESEWHEITNLTNVHGPLLGANMQQGSRLSADLACEQFTGGAFNGDCLWTETNPGFSTGTIYTVYINATAGKATNPVPNPAWNSATQGTGFLMLPSASPMNLARTPLSDTFTRPNASTLGPMWTIAGTGIQAQITSNAATANGSGQMIWTAQTFNNDQFSEAVVNTVDGVGFAEVITNGLIGGSNNFYQYACQTTARSLFKNVAGSGSTLATKAVGCAVGDKIRLEHVGTELIAYYTPSGGSTIIDFDIQDASLSGGYPGIIANTLNDSLTNWKGGSLPIKIGTDSIYTSDVYHGIPRKNFVDLADYTNATTTFSNVVGVGAGASAGLAFPVEARGRYTLHCSIVWSASAATAGPQFQITGPASPTSISISMLSAITATTTASAAATAFASALNPVGATVTNGVNERAEIDMGLVNGVNAGTIQLQAAAQGVGTLTIRQGSSCTLQ